MRTGFTLAAIVTLAAVLRFYQLGKNPPSLNLDEVAIGYNAYSILKTGMDEYGKRLPLVFRSHDDYKPPLYIYLSVPSIAASGLNPFAVRFPSALAGTLTVLLTYFLVRELFPRLKLSVFSFQFSVGEIAALLLAISPWHLQVSRVAFETNIAVFLTVLGVWTFLKGIRGNGRWWIGTAASFSLSLYTYQTSRLFIPLFLVALAGIYGKTIWLKRRDACIAAFAFLILSLPLSPILFSQAGLMRFKGTSVFEHPGLVEKETGRRVVDAQRQDWLGVKFLHNRYFAGFLTVSDGYLKHFQPDLLFLGTKGMPYNHAPNVGLLYLGELPLILLGLCKMAHLKDRRPFGILLGWLLLSPVASALTWDIPSSVRMTVALPTLQIFSAVGVLTALAKVTKMRKGFRIVTFMLSAVLVAGSVYHYLHQYYVHGPLEFAESWQYGYKEAAEYADLHKDENSKVIVSTNLRQPQNFFAFYTKYDPWTYINIDGGTVSGGFLETKNKFGKFLFQPINYSEGPSETPVLLVDLYAQTPKSQRDEALKVIRLPNGEPTVSIMKR